MPIKDDDPQSEATAHHVGMELAGLAGESPITMQVRRGWPVVGVEEYRQGVLSTG